LKINIHATCLLLTVLKRLWSESTALLATVIAQGSLTARQARALTVKQALLTHASELIVHAMKADKNHFIFRDRNTDADWKLLDSITTNLEVTDQAKYNTQYIPGLDQFKFAGASLIRQAEVNTKDSVTEFFGSDHDLVCEYYDYWLTLEDFTNQAAFFNVPDTPESIAGYESIIAPI
jgi:hypothetical protein